MNNSIVSGGEGQDLQNLKDRVERLEKIFFDLNKISVLHSCGGSEDQAAGASIQNNFEIVRQLTEAIDAYRMALQLRPRFSRLRSIASNLEPEGHANRTLIAIRDKVFELEINKLQDELKKIRRRYFYLKHFMYFLRLFHGLFNIFKPKLGRLFIHDPIPIAPWGFPPGVSLSKWPKISIVTPSFRQGEFIGRTIESVLSQNYSNLQYFIQDGGSNDRTLEVIKTYSDRLTAWTSEADSGQSEAINKGFSRSTGEIMAWLNSDDLLMPGTLAYVADYFAKHPNVDVVYGHRILIDERDREIGRWILPKHDSKVLSWADFVPQETLFWRRSIWEKTGGRLDESFRFAMDWDLLIRFRDAGARMVRLPFFMGAFRIHEAQKTSANINSVGMMEMDRLRERCHAKKPSHLEIRAAVTSYMLKHVYSDFFMRLQRALRLF